MNVKAVVYEAEEGGYWGEVPAFPGCVSQGETRDEIKKNLQEAIQAWLLAGEVDLEMTSSEQTLLLAV